MALITHEQMEPPSILDTERNSSALTASGLFFFMPLPTAYIYLKLSRAGRHVSRSGKWAGAKKNELQHLRTLPYPVNYGSTGRAVAT